MKGAKVCFVKGSVFHDECREAIIFVASLLLLFFTADLWNVTVTYFNCTTNDIFCLVHLRNCREANMFIFFCTPVLGDEQDWGGIALCFCCTECSWCCSVLFCALQLFSCSREIQGLVGSVRQGCFTQSLADVQGLLSHLYLCFCICRIQNRLSISARSGMTAEVSFTEINTFQWALCILGKQQ